MVAKRRKRKILLMNRDPRCHWCGEPVVLVEGNPGRLQSNEATIDHLYPRSDPRRKLKHRGETTVLACYNCNQRRNTEDQLSHAIN